MTASYPWFGEPPPRIPRPSATVPTLRGKRVILSTPEGFVYDMRAVSERYVDASGLAVIDILSDDDYYRLMYLGQRAEPAAWAAHLVWVE